MASGRLDSLFNDGLQSLYGAHHQGARQAAANIKTSSSRKLRSMLRAGSKRNLAQARRLETVFRTAGLVPKGQHDAAMQGIVDANETLVGQAPDAAARDLVNIASGQVAAHFYLATYGTLRSYARLLGHRKAVGLLGKTMRETSAVDRSFTKLAQALSRQPGSVSAQPVRTWTGAIRPVATVAALTGMALLAAFAAAGDRRQ